MARLETTVKQVVPGTEGSTIKSREQFGWIVLSVQEVSNNYLESGVGDTIYSVTESHIKVTFQRDTGMKNYSDISRLEKAINNKRSEVSAYNKSAGDLPVPKKIKFLITSVFTIMCIVIGVIYLTVAEDLPMGAAVPIFMLGIAFLISTIVLCVKYKKKKKKWAEGYKAFKDMASAKESEIRLLYVELQDFI